MKLKDVLDDYIKLKNKSEHLSSLLIAPLSEETKSRVIGDIREIQTHIKQIENIEVDHKRIVG
ncbi:hypothetical protein BCP8-2_160 [Bacillus phage BCP8-2]|uniref:Uncharacterized protein n=1 Tax=Bacillus phage BCP8-2 TaxID=1129192 RepID=A0A0E3D9T8_9CAUD|nr:hypothetical protein BCP8-2_160 [Bacillus phage BCP8-2]AHJ87198.1 hypothetical protein BCP8-2_160 [Bacillus phage BCP8-2]UJH95632.1 hypothetical protein [Bacillus phage vB_BtM_BMBsp2]